MPYREETRRVFEKMRKRLKAQGIDEEFLRVIQALIEQEKMDNAEAIMERLRKWPPQEDEKGNAKRKPYTTNHGAAEGMATAGGER